MKTKEVIVADTSFRFRNNSGKYNMAAAESANTKDDKINTSFNAFIFSVIKKKEKKEKTSIVPFYKLFRFATYFEIFIVCCGVLFSILTGMSIPVQTILYGEFTSLLVDRTSGNTTTKTMMLNWFGGGRILDSNASSTERSEAILEDSAAFGIGLTVMSLVQFVISTVAVDFLNFVCLKQVGRIRELLLRSALAQDMTWYDLHAGNNFAGQLTENMDKIKDGIGEKISIFAYLVMSFVFSIIISFTYGWELTLVVLSCAPVIIITTAVVAKIQSTLTAKELKSYSSAGSVAEEVLSSIRTVVAFGGEYKEIDRYNNCLNPAIRQGTRKGLFSGIGSGIMWFVIYCSYSLAFWYGVNLIMEGRGTENPEYTPAVLTTVFFGILMGAQNFGFASPHIEAFSVARGAGATVFSIIDRVPTINPFSTEGLKPKSISGTIELKDIHFQYPSRPDVKIMQGFNLKIKSGETVALVGASGCGKSTVIQLLQRLYDPISGVVYLDGNNIKTLNIRWLRSHVAVVGQEPALFTGTIRENIAYGGDPMAEKDELTQSQIEDAAKQANCHDFIKKFPDGYDTSIGGGGAQLSGGQRQRIALARALVRQPTVLLLDEATSALDVRTEDMVTRALRASSAATGRTTIIVAHRLSTVAYADRIVCVKEGNVVEEGAYSDLIDAKGVFYQLVKAHEKEKDTNSDKKDTEGPRHQIKRQDTVESSKTRSIKSSISGDITEDINDGEDSEDSALPKVSLKRIMAANSPEWLYIVTGCLAAVIVGASFPAFAILYGEIFGVFSFVDPEEVRKTTNFYSLLFLAIGVFVGVATFLQTHMFNVAGVKLTTRLRKQSFAAFMKQEIGWHDRTSNGVGALCARLSGDAANVQGATGTRIGVMLQALSTLGLGIVISFVLSWKMTLVGLICIPLVFIAVYLESRLTETQALTEKKAMENATKIAVEAISNIKTIASLAREDTFLEKYLVELHKANNALQKKTKLRGVVYSLGQVTPFLAYALVLYYGGTLVANEGVHYTTILKVSEALIFGAWMLGQGFAFAPNFNMAKISASKIFKLLDRIPLIHSAPILPGMDSWHTDGSINYKDIQFHYPSRPNIEILQGLNLEIKPGQTVALVGPSGCGKSTCIQLLQRLYDPDSGFIILTNKSIRNDLTLANLRKEMGLVSQEPVLFDRTIAENIAYGDNTRDVSMDEIIEASKKSNIHNFISSLPQGYETRVGSRGTQLSGGQKQRIAIARALVRNPRILLLDEATSALDNQSEKVVQVALDHAREGRTCIVIAHRLTTIQNADVICVINKGKISEAGTHSELLMKKGLYTRLHALQMS